MHQQMPDYDESSDEDPAIHQMLNAQNQQHRFVQQ
jgi:hypothetical protein